MKRELIDNLVVESARHQQAIQQKVYLSIFFLQLWSTSLKDVRRMCPFPVQKHAKGSVTGSKQKLPDIYIYISKTGPTTTQAFISQTPYFSSFFPPLCLVEQEKVYTTRYVRKPLICELLMNPSQSSPCRRRLANLPSLFCGKSRRKSGTVTSTVDQKQTYETNVKSILVGSKQ